MRKILVLLTALLSSSMSDPSDYRLPKKVYPIFYNITTDVDLDYLTFQGYIEITIDVVAETDRIVLHALDLTFLKIRLFYDDDKEEVRITNTTLDKEMETLTIHLEEDLDVARYKIEADYQGKLNEHNEGLYRSNYTDIDSESYWRCSCRKKRFPSALITFSLYRHLAVTQFQTTHARKAFPCFDEPAFKANFSISVIRDEEYNSISNMPLVNTT